MPYPARIASTVELVASIGGPVRASEVPGLSRARVRAAVADGALLTLRRGIVLPRVVWDAASPLERHRLALQAALEAFPGSWASHSSAAALHGLVNVMPDPYWHRMVHISRTGVTHREAGLVVHGQEVPDGQLTTVQGLACSSLPRACIEVAARRRIEDALGVLDAGMRATIACAHSDVRRAVLDPAVREATWREFDLNVAPYTRHRWVTTVRQAIRWADPAAESRLESLSRAQMLMAELPTPQCGVPLTGDDGRLYWVDFWWEDRRLIGEVDGLVKYADASALLAEKLRQEALTGPGRSIVRWGYAQVHPNPEAMLARVRVLL